jgi:hypothetical protein
MAYEGTLAYNRGMIRRWLLVALGFLALAVGTAPAQDSTPVPQLDIRTLLKTGRFKAQEYRPSSSPRFIELGNRLKAAAEKDPDWAQEQSLNAKPGEPLPYDPKMGLTEAEYREFLKLQETIAMKPVRTVTVVVEPNMGGWRFGPATTAKELHSIAVDTLRDQVHTPYGDLNPGPRVVASDFQRATGRWNGLRWRGDFVDPQTQSGTVVVFAVGKHVETGRTVLYLEKRRMDHGRIVENTKSFFRFLGATAGKPGAAKPVSKKAGAKKATARKAG